MGIIIYHSSVLYCTIKNEVILDEYNTTKCLSSCGTDNTLYSLTIIVRIKNAKATEFYIVI